MAEDLRISVARARRVVLKVGSRVIADDGSYQKRLSEELSDLVKSGRSFVIVSSGAIAIGFRKLGYKSRPKEMARLQASAAAGQSVLMRRYEESFAEHGVTVAQVLLTHTDLADRERVNNAREAFAALLEAGAVPIVNENDTVSTEEIRFGDNDQLAAMVTPLVGADLLVLLTDVDGVLDESGQRIPTMTDDAVVGQVRATTEKLGSGGMESKIDAARKAARSGANVVIGSGQTPGSIRGILLGEDVGTLFPAQNHALRARKHWIAYTLKPRGDVLLDAGAVRALAGGRSSLLSVGVLGVRGDFGVGDAVRLVSPDGFEVGRGLARMSALDVARSAGKHQEELADLLGPDACIVVHKDDLVVDGGR